MRADLRETMARFADLTDRFNKFTEIQIERMAQIQAELDAVRAAWTKMTLKRRRDS